METRQLTCISCPIGCLLAVSLENGVVREVTGNQCGRGVAYAGEECAHPTRMMTTTVRLRGAAVDAAPVKTSRPIPKDTVVACVRALKDIELDAPVTLGQLVLADVCGTGADVVATRSIPHI